MGVNGKWFVHPTYPFLDELTMRKPELENAPQAADKQDKSDDSLRRLAYEAPEQTRCEIMQSMWRDRLLIRVTDEKSGEVMLASEPLFRFFTISHEWIARKLERNHGGGPVGKKDLQTQTERILNSIQDSVRRHHGVVADEDFAAEVDFQAPFVYFGNDGYVIGLFFSQNSRNAATEEILSKGEDWGVRMETTAAELDERQEQRERCQENFDEGDFRSRFQSLSHEERLAEIQLLWQQGIGFETSDPDTGTPYSSAGGISYCYVDYSLGIVLGC